MVKAKKDIGLDEEERRWFAVYTKYKREKIVLKHLTERGIEAYLPVQSYTRRYTRKIRHVEIPLISCYIFTKINQQHYIPVLETPDVVNFVKPAKTLIAIPDSEMLLMKRVVGEGMELEAEPSSYQIGDEVEIIGGNLTGIKGWLVETQTGKNFVIELDNLGYSLRMTVDPAILRKTGRHSAAEAPKRQPAHSWGLL